MPDEPFSFEKAYGRLETILEQMNAGTLSLDASLKLYEEADALITACSKRLDQAEQKIEKLIKTRDGTVATAPDGSALTEPFIEIP